MAATKSSAWDIRFPSPVGSPYAVPILVKVTTTPTLTNDTLKLCQLTRNITILDGLVQAPDADSSTGLVFSVQITNGTTTKTLISLSTAGQAGGIIRPTKLATSEDAIGFTLNNDNYWLEILWTTQASGTAASGVWIVMVMVSGWYAYNAVTE